MNDNQPFPRAQNEQPEMPPAAPVRRMRVEHSQTRPLVAYIILALTIGVYLLQELHRIGIAREPFLALGSAIMGEELWQSIPLVNRESNILFLLGGKISFLIASGQWWRLVTPALLHASLLHLGFNMYALFSLGPALESNYGHGRFLALYLISAIGGNVASYLMSLNPSIGASTAIFGLVAAEAVFIFQNRKIFGERARSILTNLVMIIGLNLTLGLTSSSIDNWGHIGGLLAGFAFAWFAGPKMDVLFTGEGTARLVNRRSSTFAWAAGAVLLALFIALTVWRSSIINA